MIMNVGVANSTILCAIWVLHFVYKKTCPNFKWQIQVSSLF
jgi:hypothetical protein